MESIEHIWGNKKSRQMLQQLFAEVLEIDTIAYCKIGREKNNMHFSLLTKTA